MKKRVCSWTQNSLQISNIFKKYSKMHWTPELLLKIKGARVHPGGCLKTFFEILGLSSGGGPSQATRCFKRPDDLSRMMVKVVRPDALARVIEIEILTSSLPCFASPPRPGRRSRSRQVAW